MRNLHQKFIYLAYTGAIYSLMLMGLITMICQIWFYLETPAKVISKVDLLVNT